MAVSLELFLGILGSVTGLMGAAGLVIHVLRYLREKPKITAEIVKAQHFYGTQGGDKANDFLGFHIDILIRNKGYRGTTIGDSILLFTIGKKEHQIIEDYSIANGSTRVYANDLVRVTPSLGFRSSYDIEPKQEKIPFKLTIPHTHGDIKLEGISDIMPET